MSCAKGKGHYCYGHLGFAGDSWGHAVFNQRELHRDGHMGFLSRLGLAADADGWLEECEDKYQYFQEFNNVC